MNGLAIATATIFESTLRRQLICLVRLYAIAAKSGSCVNFITARACDSPHPANFVEADCPFEYELIHIRIIAFEG